MGKAFTFRAQAALDLRRREHDAARRARAAAELALAAARRRFDETCDALCAARDRMGLQMLERHASAHLAWHRVWIHRLERSRSDFAAAVADHEARVAAAAAACAAARQRLESLERLKEKARRAWDEAERARERRELDAMATMRYQAAIRESAMRSTP